MRRPFRDAPPGVVLYGNRSGSIRATVDGDTPRISATADCVSSSAASVTRASVATTQPSSSLPLTFLTLKALTGLK